MKIELIPNENPLHSYFEIDEDAFKLFTKNVHIHILEDIVFDVQHYLGSNRPETALKSAMRYGDDFDDKLADIAKGYREYLKYPHGGDCVCSPGTCLKCFAEYNFLKKSSIEGLDKHMGVQLSYAYGHKVWPPDSPKTINNAIRILEVRYKNRDTDELEARWDKERQDALEWLKNYKEKYFKEI